MMTPKEKAKELVDKFKKVELYHYMEPTNFDYEIKDISSASFTAKQCSLISVDEIINSRPVITDSQLDYHKYWLEVKQEIEQL